jgi:membrane protease YdiL (CAAX protease family)
VTPPLPQSAALPPPSPEDAVAQTGVSRWRWWIHLLLIGGYPILTMTLAWRRHAPHHPALTNTPRGLLIVCAVELALFAFVFALAWMASRASREELLLPWRPGWSVVPLGIAYSVAIRFAVVVVIVVVVGILATFRVLTPQDLQEFTTSNRPDVERIVDVSAMRKDPVYFWLTITLASFVVAGVREEMWRGGTLAAMRALWPDTFGSRAGQLAAVSLVAIVFGAAHLEMGMFAAVVAGLLGLLLGVIMVWHRSIWPAVIAHGFFDATSMALLPWSFERLRQLH